MMGTVGQAGTGTTNKASGAKASASTQNRRQAVNQH